MKQKKMKTLLEKYKKINISVLSKRELIDLKNEIDEIEYYDVEIKDLNLYLKLLDYIEELKNKISLL